MPHTKRNNYKTKWLSARAHLNQTSLKAAEPRIADAARKLNNFEVSHAVIDSTTLLLEKEYTESIEMMSEYSQLTDINFDPISYSSGGGIGNKIKVACGVMAIMRERLGIIYEAFIDLTQTANDSKAALDQLLKSVSSIESFTKELEIKPGPGTLTARDPSNIAGLMLKGKKVKFHNLTPIEGEQRLRAELVDSTTPISPRSELGSNRPVSPRVMPTSQWPPFLTSPRHQTAATSSVSKTIVDQPVDDDTEEEEGSISAVLESATPSEDPSPSRPARTIDVRPGNSRVLLRPEAVRPIPTARPSSGWRSSLPGMSDIDWKSLRKAAGKEDRPFLRTLTDGELYDIIVEKKRVRKRPELADNLRSLL